MTLKEQIDYKNYLKCEIELLIKNKTIKPNIIKHDSFIKIFHEMMEFINGTNASENILIFWYNRIRNEEYNKGSQKEYCF